MVNLDCSKGNPKPTLFGLGTMFSSVSEAVPAPNCICSDPESTNLVANLLCTCSNCKMYGVSALPEDLLGSLGLVFLIPE